MKDLGFGYKLLSERVAPSKVCKTCSAAQVGDKEIIFHSYEDGNIWFDLIDNTDIDFPRGGKRINVDMNFSVYDLHGLQEALTTLQVYPGLEDFQKEFDDVQKLVLARNKLFALN